MGNTSRCLTCNKTLSKCLFFDEKTCKRCIDIVNKKKADESERRLHPGEYKSKEYNRSVRLKDEYGITQYDWNKMFKKQNGECAICKTHQSDLNGKLVVDHNHETNKVRALLCAGCNSMIGLAKEREIVLMNAAEYLYKHND